MTIRRAISIVPSGNARPAPAIASAANARPAPPSTVAPAAKVRVAPSISIVPPPTARPAPAIPAVPPVSARPVPAAPQANARPVPAVPIVPHDNPRLTPSITIVPSAHAHTTPAITWPAPEPITYGDTLTTAQLNATASVAGSFDYSPAPGKVLAAGTHSLSVIFMPADGANYATAQANVPLNVAKATPVVAWPESRSHPLRHHPRRRAASCHGVRAGKLRLLSRAWKVVASGHVHALGNLYPYRQRQLRHHADQRAAGCGQGQRRSFVWPRPDPIPYGTPISATQLCATASVPGEFDYSPARGELLAAGSHALSVTFTPSDSENYATTQAAVSLEVAKATPVIGVARARSHHVRHACSAPRSSVPRRRCPEN